MTLRAIVHPAFMTELVRAGHEPQTVTIERATVTRDAYGQPTSTWATLAGHAAIDAQVAPAGGTEIASATGVYTDASATITLAGEYPSIRRADRVTDDSGRSWDILAIDIGPHGGWTRLVVRDRDVGSS